MAPERHSVAGTEYANRRWSQSGGGSREYRTLKIITDFGFTLSEMGRQKVLRGRVASPLVFNKDHSDLCVENRM